MREKTKNALRKIRDGLGALALVGAIVGGGYYSLKYDTVIENRRVQMSPSRPVQDASLIWRFSNEGADVFYLYPGSFGRFDMGREDSIKARAALEDRCHSYQESYEADVYLGGCN